jgi:RNA polymerase sigma-70 factor (ECF subfamily)
VLARALESLHARDGGRLLSQLIRRLGSFDRAEEALQDAYAKALANWPAAGMPDNPSAWIATVALRSGLDRLKHDRRSGNSDSYVETLAAPETEENRESDDRLALIFTCCHPALAGAAQVALALRTLGGLTTAQIARAFLEPESTTAQRIVRAKRKIAQAMIPYEVPAGGALAERLAAVLAVLYFIFNEGYAAADGSALQRPDLCIEAIRLARMLVELMPMEPEARGVLALMLFHESRRPTRTDSGGVLVPLESQDRTRWDQSLIAEATRLLDQALLLRRPGPYQIQGAIAALHARSPSAEATDWMQISALYAALLRHCATPVVELNAAVALAMASSMEEGLAWIDRLDASGTLENYHLLHAARADLLRRAGRKEEAIACYAKAISLTSNGSERCYLERRRSGLMIQAGAQHAAEIETGVSTFPRPETESGEPFDHAV